MASPDLAFERGLPANVDAERFVLGAILLDDALYIQVAGTLAADDFSLEKHRRIFGRMGDLSGRGERVDRVTLAEELMRNNQLESVDGLGYLVSLDDGLPQVYNLDSYIRIIKDKAVLRRMIFAAQGLIDRCFLAEEDPNQILATAEETLLKLGESRIKETLANTAQIIQEFEGGINAFLDPSRRIKGVSSGFVKLDEMTGGFHEGELIILAARPAMGKTALAMNIAHHICTNPKIPKTVAVFSLEMSKESLLTRMICAGARVDQQKFRAGYLNQEERRRLMVALNQLVEAPLYIDDTPAVNLMDVHAKLRRLQSEQGLGLVIIDYLQLMQGRGRYENRVQEVSSLSRGLKLMAKDLRVPMLVLSQLSRAPETRPGDHVPQLSDLRESGCLSGSTLIAIPGEPEPVALAALKDKTNFPVWALNPTTLRLEKSIASRAFSTGVQPIFRMRTGTGRTIHATANHKFLTLEGWKRLDEIATGERIAIPRHAFPAPDAAVPLPALEPSIPTARPALPGRQAESRRNQVAMLQAQVLARLIHSDVQWDAVTGVTPQGSEEVFDITVPGPHNFIANGIVAHNSIEQDADLVGFIFREEVYKPDREDLKGLAQFIIAKQRNGPIGRVNMVFLREYTKFENPTNDLEES